MRAQISSRDSTCSSLARPAPISRAIRRKRASAAVATVATSARTLGSTDLRGRFSVNQQFTHQRRCATIVHPELAGLPAALHRQASEIVAQAGETVFRLGAHPQRVL